MNRRALPAQLGEADHLARQGPVQETPLLAVEDNDLREGGAGAGKGAPSAPACGTRTRGSGL